ncbi:tRNA (guanosine(46)-N7)-methyltransferase TrmB [Kocuria sp. JC486]|uniref:tRNA (guanine-N(7)-)-methyltransferase n=1 Tax=Kocuria soli TaxID=2485125 RepID=A0A3N3ZTJ1_9MICC|nr:MULTISPECIES: tRNA (guanosine(46)-N7)-methyltransferase TrmB [Kocuria]NHU85026.1 tRNA (guanosine(46)-N7)-methyltransferase TrmB [Kocuria sp. JC486]ROZ65620.1 tRNA (guanosine(46)-N7)-methyltransferase TrmB [Kocuria soli]
MSDTNTPEPTPAATTPESEPTPLAEAQQPGEVPQEFRRRPFSFVRRGDRLTPRRQKAWDQWAPSRILHVPREVTDTSVAAHAEFDQAAAYGRTAPLVVEIGSGLGEAMAHRAAEVPEHDFLAVEVYTPGLADLLIKTAANGAQNVRAVQANAPEALEHFLKPNSVDELWVFFPDPWHKKKHHKRRLVSPAFVDQVANVLKTGATWRLATDWQEYAVQMREVIEADGRFENLNPGPLATQDAPDQGWAPRWKGRTLTSFERKAREAGRVPRDLTYRYVGG